MQHPIVETTTTFKGLKRKPIQRKVRSIGVAPKRRVAKRETPVKRKLVEKKTRVRGLIRADKEISDFIRAKYGKCMYQAGTYRCPVSDFDKLQCSHYVGRARNSTRFFPDNLIALCKKHHYGDKLIGWEFAKQRIEKHGRDGEYTTFMKQFLGERFTELDLRGTQSMKRTKAIEELMAFLEEEKLPKNIDN